jgi:hypothetical protein
MIMMKFRFTLIKQSLNPVYGSFPSFPAFILCIFVLMLSAGKLIQEQTTPEINDELFDNRFI